MMGYNNTTNNNHITEIQWELGRIDNKICFSRICVLCVGFIMLFTRVGCLLDMDRVSVFVCLCVGLTVCIVAHKIYCPEIITNY